MLTLLLQTLAELSATLLVLSGTLRGAAVQAQEIPPTEPIEMSELDTIKHYIVVSAHQNGVNPDLALFLAEKESRFNAKAVNPKSGASGIYQFLTRYKTSTWNTHCVGNVLDYQDNINCAMKMLADKANISHWNADENIRRALFEKGFTDKEGNLVGEWR